jgi:hypothetical protein
MAALQPDTGAKTLHLAAGAASLKGAPGFTETHWPDTSTAGWDAPFAVYWDRQGIRVQP